MEGIALSKGFLVIFILITALSGCSGKTKEELYSEAVKQARNANPSGAIVLLKNALEKDPNYLDARYQLALAYTSIGKYEQAEREFQKVLRQSPSYPELKLSLAKLHTSANRPDEAIGEAMTYLKQNPGSVEALETLAQANVLKRDMPQAESYLLQALKGEPGRTSAQVQLAAVYLAENQRDKARQVIGEILKRDPNNMRANYLLASIEIAAGNRDTAIAIYQRIATAHPADSQALYKAGLIYLEKGDAAEAEQTAALLEKKFPKRAEGSRLMGLVLYQKKKLPEAITALQASIKIRPSLEAYYFLGLSFYGRGDLESALSQFRKILDVNSSFTRARILSATILLQQRRTDDAVMEINKVLEVDPGNALAHNLLGSAYMAKGMYDEGMKELTRATELDPKIIDAHLKKGIFLLSRGKAREAETELVTAVQVAPEILNTRLILSAYHLRRGNFAKALSVTREGLTGGKKDAPLYNNLARIQFAERKPAEGIRSLEKAKASDPAFLATYFNLATYHAASGSYDKALAEYSAVLRLDPRNTRAMLSSAALLQLKGEDKDALAMYKKAKDTKQPVAYLALAGYHLKKKENCKALSVLDEAISSIPRNASALEMKGLILLEEKEYRQAIHVFDDLESISPDRGLRLKVRTYVLMKDFAKAEEQARRSITLRPNSASGHILLASVYGSRNELPRAIEEVKRGMSTDAKDPKVAVLLGDLLARKRDFGPAMDAYREAARRNPNYAPAYFSQGALLEMSGKKKEAVEKYRDALEKDEDHVPTLNNLAYLYAEGYGDRGQALRMSLTAFRLEPGNPAVLDTFGYVLLQNGRAKEARKLLEKAVSLLPANPTVTYHLALAEYAAGDERQAVARMQKALKMGAFPESSRAISLVAKWTGKERGK
jgi:putative PEP-CTERM system TPR-repeat lipoprotein